MNDDFAERLSERGGGIHTVCVGRPFGIDYLACARRGIHVHLYGNAYDDVWRTIARDLSIANAEREASLVARHVHVHRPLQPTGGTWDEVRRAKSAWVREFSRYDAGWSYVGRPLPWDPLDDRAAIPSKVSTCLLAGLPVIGDVRPGYYRYDELARLGINVDLVDYDDLRARLEREVATRERSANAVRGRGSYSFDASIDALVATIGDSRDRYFARPYRERSRGATTGSRVVHLAPSPDPRTLVAGIVRRFVRPRPAPGAALQGRLADLADLAHHAWRGLVVARRARALAKRFAPVVDPTPPAPARSRFGEPLTVALLERFADASRRCDDAHARLASGRVEVVDLPDPLRAPAAFLRELPGAIGDWIAIPASLRERASLACAAARTGGARAGALLRAPGLLRRVRHGRIDAIACYSAKDFPLADLLAREAGSPPRELLASGTRYFGEFAFELLAVIPYAYWLHRQGRLAFTESTAGTRCLYWFSPDHRERPVDRRFVPITEYPSGVPGRLRYDRTAFPEVLDTGRWTPPPYREVYQDERFRFDRPTCVVCNKATDEHFRWHRSMTNHLPNDVLLDLVGRLRSRYQVVYNRPRAADIVNDHQPIREPGDIEAVKDAYPDVLTIQELLARHPEFGYNELQLRLYAGCERFVSVLGGSSYLASWFGGVNVVYARRGWEVACGAYDRWFDRFSGARVVAAPTHAELLRVVGREML